MKGIEVKKGLFITGTDTGVGKTLVTCAIIRAMAAWHFPVFAAKPLATGSEMQPDGSLRHPDVAQISKALGGGTVWVGYESPHPAAPSLASRWEGKYLDADDMARSLRAVVPADHVAVVEGAGGILCPLAPGKTIADFAAKLELPVLVVAKRALGTLNHTLLTLEAAQQRGLRVAGIVFNQTHPGNDPVEEAVAEEMARLTTVPVLAQVPFGDLSGKILENIPWPSLMAAG